MSLAIHYQIQLVRFVNLRTRHFSIYFISMSDDTIVGLIAENPLIHVIWFIKFTLVKLDF